MLHMQSPPVEPPFSQPQRASHTLTERLLILPHILVLPRTCLCTCIHPTTSAGPLSRAEGPHTCLTHPCLPSLPTAPSRKATMSVSSGIGAGPGLGDCGSSDSGAAHPPGATAHRLSVPVTLWRQAGCDPPQMALLGTCLCGRVRAPTLARHRTQSPRPHPFIRLHVLVLRQTNLTNI